MSEKKGYQALLADSADAPLQFDMLMLPSVGVLIKDFLFDTTRYAALLAQHATNRRTARKLAKTRVAFMPESPVFVENSKLTKAPGESSIMINGEYFSRHDLVAVNIGDCIRADLRRGRPLGSSLNHAVLHETGHRIDDVLRRVLLEGLSYDDAYDLHHVETYHDTASERSAETFAAQFANLDLLTFSNITNYTLD